MNLFCIIKFTYRNVHKNATWSLMSVFITPALRAGMCVLVINRSNSDSDPSVTRVGLQITFSRAEEISRFLHSFSMGLSTSRLLLKLAPKMTSDLFSPMKDKKGQEK